MFDLDGVGAARLRVPGVRYRPPVLPPSEPLTLFDDDFVQSSKSSDPVEVGTSIELFTGGGGLAQAMHEVGFRHLLCNEFAKRACETLRLNWADDWDPAAPLPASLNDRWPLIEGDIQSIKSFGAYNGKVDVVAGGPPCQPFSLGGVHKGDEDKRNMFPQLFRVIRETSPRAVICENVQGLLRGSFKPYFDYILRELSAPFEERNDEENWEAHDTRLRKLDSKRAKTGPLHERYDVYPMAINAADYGVPQIRRRVIIVAFRRDLGVSWSQPKATHSEASLVRDQVGKAYWDKVRKQRKPEVYEKRAKVKFAEEEYELEPWITIRQALREAPRLPDPRSVKAKKIPDHIFWPGARIYKGHTPNLMDRPAKTVKAGVHGVPGGESVLLEDDGSHRYMTVREVARVMTFPDDWKLAGPRGEQMRQLGNAVPVRLGRVIAQAVAEALRPDIKVAQN